MDTAFLGKFLPLVLFGPLFVCLFVVLFDTCSNGVDCIFDIFIYQLTFNPTFVVAIVVI